MSSNNSLTGRRPFGQAMVPFCCLGPGMASQKVCVPCQSRNTSKGLGSLRSVAQSASDETWQAARLNNPCSGSPAVVTLLIITIVRAYKDEQRIWSHQHYRSSEEQNSAGLLY